MGIWRRRTVEAIEPGYPVYAEYIAEQVALQEARKESLEKRGLAVLTTAGALVTILFALASLSTRKAQTFEIPTRAQISLIVALGLFFVCACAAIATNVPVRYRGVVAASLRGDLERGGWTAPREAAQRKVTATRLDVLEDAQRRNTRKAWLLLAAGASEVLAVAAVGAAIGFVIAS